MIRTWASIDRAFAISTICCWPTRNRDTGMRGSTDNSSCEAIRLLGDSCGGSRSTPVVVWDSRPRKMFSATVS